MGFSLPLGPALGVGDGAWPEDRLQIALPGDQREGFPFQEAAPFPPFACRSRSKCSLKRSVLHVDACLLEKMLGPNRALLTAFQREFQVQLQMGEPDPEGKVEVSIVGRQWNPKRAKKMIQSLTGKSQRKRYGGLMGQVVGAAERAVLRGL
ncbi:unnamed protein product [Pipistrellus nathusii]|uniref:KH-like RNA-binding domain-containing protein n=1 Tax=Pipistrellus nathusii TaxID=59473 RepID=A0ABP0A8M3_PIPNA